MRRVLWSLIKVSLKSPFAVFIAFLTVSMGLASVGFTIGLPFGLWEMGTEAFGAGVNLSGVFSLLITLLSGVFLIVLYWSLAKGLWGFTRTLFDGVSKDAVEARDSVREVLSARADRAEALEAQGGMLSVSVDESSGGGLTQTAHAGLEVVAQEVTLDLEEEAEQEVV